jgi:hypothetical protein
MFSQGKRQFTNQMLSYANALVHKGRSCRRAGFDPGTAVASNGITEIEMTRSNMALVKVGVTKMSVPAKIQFTRQIVLDMSDNPNFAAPSPALKTLSDAAAALEYAYNAALQARANAKMQTSVMGQKSAVLDSLLMQEASYVQNSSGGDKAKIESAGFDVRDTPTPIGQLPAPAEPKAAPSQNAGTINLTWKKVRGAKSYLVERAVDSNQRLEWAAATTSTKTKAIVNTMTSGLRYWFRVAAVGSAGQGAWSEPVSKIAP